MLIELDAILRKLIGSLVALAGDVTELAGREPRYHLSHLHLVSLSPRYGLVVRLEVLRLHFILSVNVSHNQLRVHVHAHLIHR